MNEKDNTSASYMDGNRSIIFQENVTNSSFEENDVTSRLFQLESLSSMERHYIKDLIKSMFRLDSDGNSNGTNGNSNEDLLSVNYSTDDEGEITEIGADNKPKPPNDHHSPSEGIIAPRSVKEVEQSHANLKKENFNLKLRIYFLEERMNTDFNINPDNAVMKNIELKVQVESLRKELTEKQEMLCQAVKTMELDEEDYKKLLAERDKKFFDLEGEYQSLHRKYEQDIERNHGDINLPDSDQAYRSFDLETLENKLEEEQVENERLRASFAEDVRSRDVRISCLQAAVDEKSAVVAEQHGRLVALDAAAEQRLFDLKRLRDEHEDDTKRIVDLEGTVRDAQQTLDTVETELEQECVKGNRMKLSLGQRNKRIMELEDVVRRQKTHIGTLEAQVRQMAAKDGAIQTSSVATSTVSVSAQCAATGTALSALNDTPPPPTSPPTDATITPQSPTNYIHIDTTNPEDTDQQNTSSNPQATEKDLQESRRHIQKLEKDRRRAGEIIHCMLEKRRVLGAEIGALREKEREKDREIGELKQVIERMNKDRTSGGGSLKLEGATLAAVAPSSSEINTDDSSIANETDICTKYQTLANDLDKQKELLLAIIEEKDSQMRKLESDFSAAQTDLRLKDERIVSLEHQIQTSSEKIDIGSEKEAATYWLLESEEKDREIDRLEAKLKQRNTDIQTLVNSELWQKNKEIEKMQQILRDKNSELCALSEELLLLKKELTKFTTAQLKDSGADVQEKLRNSIEDRKRILDQIEVMYADTDYPKDYLQLRNEHKQLKSEYERSEHLREQTNEICAVLSGRLEELAFFLDSLLKQKSLLGFLGSQRNTRLRHIIDRSLDLSRTLNMNLSHMNADQSLLQLANISNCLNSAVAEVDLEVATVQEDRATVISEQARVISVLQEQIEAMKRELNGKREITCTYDDSVANILLDIAQHDGGGMKKGNMAADEEESWSEPDRDVSKERIGLSGAVGVFDVTTETNTEDDKEPPKKSKRVGSKVLLLDENRELKEKLTASSDLLLQTERSFEAVTEQLKVELDALRLDNTRLLARIQDRQTQLDAYESNSQRQIGELHGIIDELHRQRDDTRRTIDTLQQNTRQHEQETHRLQMAVDEYRVNVEGLCGERVRLEERVREVRAQSDAEVQRITETALLMKRRYESEYVKRAELDRMMGSIKELESLQVVLNATEEKIELLEGNEVQLKGQLQDAHRGYREKLVEMRKELDMSTLKFSEVMLERTRQMKERAALELQIKEYALKEEDFKRQVAEFQMALNGMKDVFQAQVANLNSQKAALQLKLAEVEMLNEELRNDRVVPDSGTRTVSQSAPSTPSKFFSMLIGRQFSYSHREQSPLTVDAHESGDDPLAQHVNSCPAESTSNGGASVAAQPGNTGNTSPDLGIDSDPGRFSSLEYSGGAARSRPFHSTLELSQQMHSVLVADAEHTVHDKHANRSDCSNDRCLTVIAENSQLRDRLLKTRSALEETVCQLKSANDKKRHVEKTICKQIHKTSQVLRKAKANLDSGSETDLRK